ncbi:MAG: cell wall-binding repeat-containing protein [Coriobacteriales bacterium]
MILPGVASASAPTPARLGVAAKAAKAASTLNGGGRAGAGVSTLVLDDDIPGAVPLGPSPVSGTVDAVSDVADVFSVDVPSGSRLSLTLTGAATLNADVCVFDRDATSIDVDTALAGTLGDALPKAVVFDVPAGVGGTYYVAVCAAAGSGSYTLAWEIVPIPSGPDDDGPGVDLPLSPASGTLDDLSDPADVYAVDLAAGERLIVSLQGPADADFDLRLFAPGTTSVYGSLPVWGAATASAEESFMFDALEGQGGRYLLDVHAVEGAGAYTITYQIVAIPADTWDTTADAVLISHDGGTTSQSLDRATDANDFFQVTLAAGERLTVTVNGAADTDFDVYVYTAAGAEPVAFANDSAYPDRVVFDAGASGAYYVEVETFSGSGPYTLSWTVTLTPEWTGTTRVEGPDRYTTAIALSASTFPAGGSETVVLATGASFPDALAASGLAGCYEGPLLLTKPDAVPSGVLAELDRLGASRVVIIGGTSAVSSGVANALGTAGYSVSRIQGANRYETAAKVGAEIARLTDDGFVHAAFVTRGDQFADALAVSPFAYSRKMPVLLTPTTSLAAETSNAIVSLSVEDVFIAGGQAAVSTPVQQAIDRLAPTVRPVVRLQGANRYATAVTVAEYAIDYYWATPEYVGVATGLNFPDALGGGAVCGARGGVLLMTSPTALSAETAAFITAHREGVLSTKVFGGTAAVSNTVKTQVDSLLGE